MIGYGKHLIADSDPQSDDIEALQTDTMRFLAILAICLMVIFALVQAMPFHPQPEPVPIPDLTERLARLKDRIEELTRQEMKLRGHIEANQAKLNQLKMDKARIHAELADARSQLTKAHDRRQRIQSEIQRSENQRDMAQSVLDRIMDRINDENENLNAVEKRLNGLTEKLNALPPPVPVPSSAAKGFLLQFKSEKALSQLISSGRVQFFAKVGEHVWQLHIQEGRPNYKEFFGKVAPSARLQTETVPKRFRQALSHHVVSFGRGNVTYYVTLPGEILGDLEQAKAGRKGGTLTISAAGKVTLQ